MTSFQQKVRGLFLFAVCAFCVVSVMGFSPLDPPRSAVYPSADYIQNLAGKPGAWCAFILLSGLGVASVIPVTAIFLQAVALIREKPYNQLFLRTVGIITLTTGIAATIAMLRPFDIGTTIGPAGYVGVITLHVVKSYVATIGAIIFIASLIVAGMILTCDTTLLKTGIFFYNLLGFKPRTANAVKAEQPKTVSVAPPVKTIVAKPIRPHLQQYRKPLVKSKTEKPPYERSNVYEDENEYDDEYNDDYDESNEYEDDYDDSEVDDEYAEDTDSEYYEEDEYDDSDEYETEEADDDCYEESYDDDVVEEPVAVVAENAAAVNTVSSTEPQQQRRSGGLLSWLLSTPQQTEQQPNNQTNIQTSDNSAPTQTAPSLPPLPSLDILTPAPPFDYDAYDETVKRQARQLERAFADFGFNVKVVDIQTGPVIAQFEIQLEKGLRLNKILGLTDDLAIALKVSSVRIVAPLPGKNTVGIELPNLDRQMVRLRDVMTQSSEVSSKMAIPIYLGMDVAGGAMPIDLAVLPHLLIAGRTGTGKSVCLNSIIVSILMTRRPDEVKMLMIDPKMVELSPYKTIPHLMHPVVTDMKKAEAILGWAVDKMEERYQLFSMAGVNHISKYNKLTESQLYKRIKPQTTDQWEAVPKRMPYLVIIADEMNDMMMTCGKEVENYIIRLAQKSRAVGIHLVLATQKPTVDVITGLIKSNLPARIAFGVATRSDSQVILDHNGAEKLLGNGDMLFLRPGTSQALRGQGTYVSDSEIEAIINVVSTGKQEFAEELVAISEAADKEANGDEDGEDDSATSGGVDNM
ncbi:MAG: DNA translocase FtsK 4TM domain-containing protein, partial [Planctomycetaceae bacterium]|nr:DNA translocase FtsK 4TM domain-containing protein [Planctomycetaceae bacterium]